MGTIVNARFELARCVIRVVTYRQKILACELGLKPDETKLIAYLQTCPGKRVVVEGWEIYLVSKRTLRYRPVNPLKTK